jgi:hypothetical protein
MVTAAATRGVGVAAGVSMTYERFAGVCAIGAALAGFLYSVAFVVLRSEGLSAVCLLLVGLLSTAALVGLYQQVRDIDAGFALLGLLLTVVGGIGAAIHGGYDLSNALHPPATTGLSVDLPSQVDPRGLLTFGLTGLGLWTLAWLIVRGGELPRRLGQLGYLMAALAIILYLGRLIVLDSTNPLILVPALLAGFVVNPAWYLWLGIVLWRGPQRA